MQLLGEKDEAGCPPFAQLIQLLDRPGCRVDSRRGNGTRLLHGEFEGFPAKSDGPLIRDQSRVPTREGVPADRDQGCAFGNLERSFLKRFVKPVCVADFLVIVQHQDGARLKPGIEFPEEASCKARGVAKVLWSEHGHG